ncbi:MAG: helix-turn-helix transcriptional regulator [Candidatus Gracilibacteria bacterium]|nr:helix-turn-helix transcriptional regulator [Candidatus Gracilibacteria bacterium]
MKKSLGERIHELRRSKKLTQAELAKLAGIPSVSISMIERNRVGNPGFKTVLKICEALEIDMNTFIQEIDR